MHGNGPTEPQLQVVITGGWCVAKKRNIQRTPPPMEKKKRKKIKGKKKRCRARVGIELANFDLTVLWFHPLRHSGINWEIAFNFSNLKPTRRSLLPYTKTKTIFPHQNEEIIRTSGQTDKRSVFFFLHVAIRNSLRSNKTRCTSPFQAKNRYDVTLANRRVPGV